MCKIRIEIDKRDQIDELMRCGWELISVRAYEDSTYVILGKEESNEANRAI